MKARIPLSSTPARSDHLGAPWEPNVRRQSVGEWCSREPRLPPCRAQMENRDGDHLSLIQREDMPKRMQRTVVHASQLARPPATDP